MNKETFKAGDEVYCPTDGFSIYIIVANPNSDYPIIINNKVVNDKGFFHFSHKAASIFHATPENKALLEALYKCEFESPKLRGSDLTRKLLSEGKHVLCYVGLASDSEALIAKVIKVIKHVSKDYFSDVGDSCWNFAVPCNDYANLPDGVLTLKSEQ